ncbi:probable mediator of RNA polymerase II transcription subunit 26b [Rhododendron vialii]|uniref:probable mediator of RNA polymerase II transcription subunit 26b n=1 Tax=Rhododendron vialii TaxID=182163 RepID=UPI00265DC568|nr:probable mediator of RNA polymerase II transcription subunit 26b [Rhododendron vialii]
MGLKPGALDDWRDYFRTSSSDIFDIIEHAIMVAASDCPQEFRIRRDRIAEKLFSCKLAKCVVCDNVELSVPAGGDGGGEEGGGCCKIVKFEEVGGGGSKGSKVNSCRDDQVVEMNVMMNQLSNYSFGEAEALTDEIEEESQIVGEVLRIKEILDNCQDESDSVLFESLRRLQLMVLSVDSLKATEIGKSVNALRKHSSKEIRHLARTLIEFWKDMVDEWVNATAAIGGTEGTPESVNPSVVDDEEGLPSPPLDEGVFFATNTTMELSQFFDGMDDDGNPRNSGEFNKNRENGRKPPREDRNIPKQKPRETHAPVIDKKGDEMRPALKKQGAVAKPSKPSSNTESGPGRPTKAVHVERKVSNGTKFQEKSDKATIIQKPLAVQQDKCLDDTARLEAAKRRLHERYQQAENAKRQRTIQVMELHDLPKQGLGSHRNANMRPGNHNRHWASGRR